MSFIAPISVQLTNRKGGRPRKYNRQFVGRILRAVAKGLPLQTAANAAGIAPSTLITYRKQHPDFDDKVKAAISKGIESRLNVVIAAMKSKDEASHHVYFQNESC